MATKKPRYPSQELKRYTLRLPEQIRTRIRRLAEDQRRSVNSMYLHILQNYLDNLEDGVEPTPEVLEDLHLTQGSLTGMLGVGLERDTEGVNAQGIKLTPHGLREMKTLIRDSLRQLRSMVLEQREELDAAQSLLLAMRSAQENAKTQDSGQRSIEWPSQTDQIKLRERIEQTQDRYDKALKLLKALDPFDPDHVTDALGSVSVNLAQRLERALNQQHETVSEYIVQVRNLVKEREKALVNY